MVSDSFPFLRGIVFFPCREGPVSGGEKDLAGKEKGEEGRTEKDRWVTAVVTAASLVTLKTWRCAQLQDNLLAWRVGGFATVQGFVQAAPFRGSGTHRPRGYAAGWIYPRRSLRRCR